MAAFLGLFLEIAGIYFCYFTTTTASYYISRFIIFSGAAIICFALIRYADWKGRSLYWGLTFPFTVIPMIILLFLKRKEFEPAKKQISHKKIVFTLCVAFIFIGFFWRGASQVLLYKIVFDSKYKNAMSCPKPENIDWIGQKVESNFSLGYSEFFVEDVNSIKLDDETNFIVINTIKIRLIFCSPESYTDFRFVDEKLDEALKKWPIKKREKFYEFDDYKKLELGVVSTTAKTAKEIFFMRPDDFALYTIKLIMKKVFVSNETEIMLFETDNFQGYISVWESNGGFRAKIKFFSKESAIGQEVIVFIDDIEEFWSSFMDKFIKSYKFTISDIESDDQVRELIINKFKGHELFSIKNSPCDANEY